MALDYAKVDVSTGLNTATRLNAELTKIETALADGLSRSGTGPNAMSADLDMGNNDILNAGAVQCGSILVGGQTIASVAALAAEADRAATAEAGAVAAQAAAESAAASINTPTLAPGDTGKILRVNAAEDGYELTAALLAGEVTTAKLADGAVTTAKLADAAVTKAKLDPALFLTAGTTISLSVETSPAGATQFADIQSAIAFARETYIPAGGILNITVNKTTLSSSDSIVPLQTDDLSWINVIFVSGSSYTIPGILVDCDAGGVSPVIKNTGACTITTSGTRILRASDFGRIKIAITGSLALNGGAAETSSGGVIQSHTGTLSMENDARCVQMIGGQILMGSAFSAESTTTDVAVSCSGPGAHFMAGAAVTLTSAGANAITVTNGAEAVLRELSATSSGTNVSASSAGTINLNGSTATCNLTNNTVSTNGILIR